MSRSLSTALRPYLHAQVKPRHQDAYLRFYAAATGATAKPSAAKLAVTKVDENIDSLWSNTSYRKRLKQLTALHPEGQNAPTDQLYPRMGSEGHFNPAEFRREAQKLRLAPGGWARTVAFKLRGKVRRVRAMGKKLLFIDVVENEERVQVMVDLGRMQSKGQHSSIELDDLRKRMAVGDHYGKLHLCYHLQFNLLTLT
jgi:lysyl-tRNA synthetase class II